jgi:hypothetical protein
MGIQSIWSWKALQRRELREKVIDARQCTAPGVQPGDGTPRLFFFQAKIRLHLYTRQRSPRKRLRSDGLIGSNPPWTKAGFTNGWMGINWRNRALRAA